MVKYSMYEVPYSMKGFNYKSTLYIFLISTALVSTILETGLIGSIVVQLIDKDSISKSIPFHINEFKDINLK